MCLLFIFIYADFEIASLRTSEKQQAYDGMFPVLLEMDSSKHRKRNSPQKFYDTLSTKFVSLPTTLLFLDEKINCSCVLHIIGETNNRILSKKLHSSYTTFYPSSPLPHCCFVCSSELIPSQH